MGRVFIGITIIAIVVAAGTAAHADSLRPVLYVASDGARVELPLVRGALRAEVRGPIAQLHVTQTFSNPYERPIEAVYMFPLPHDGAVGAMTMRVGTRTIRARIARREQARAEYERALSEGKIAALLDQERPNVFTQAVANIGPGESVDIAIDVDVLLSPLSGTWELVMPTVVGPRYKPGQPSSTPAHTLPAGLSSGNTLAFDLDLLAMAPLGEIDSPTHDLVVTPLGPTRARVALAGDDMVRTSDLVVRWRTVVREPTAAILAHRDGDLGHLALVVTPPPVAAGRRRPRDLVFVVDTSGLMSGPPLALARRAMRYALDQLQADDTFRILNFASDVSGFDGGHSQRATPDSLRRAGLFVDALASAGGTEMIHGIEAALEGGPAEGRERHVVFMTDGYIGNESQILAAIERRLPRATRLFSFGVGNAVNRYLLDGMARVGRGAVQYMLLAEPPEAQIATFYRRLDQPALTDVRIDWGGLAVADAEPDRLPDVFAGQPLVVSARYLRAGRGSVTIHARADGAPVALVVPVELPDAGGDGAVLGRLWARHLLRRLGDLSGGDHSTQLVARITDVALTYQLMSPHTSFIAVEQRVTNTGGVVETIDVPVEMPVAVDFGGYHGDALILGGAAMERSYAAGEVIHVEPASRWSLGLTAGGGLTGGGAAFAATAAVDVRFGYRHTAGLDAQLLLRADQNVMATIAATVARLWILELLHLRLGAGPAFTADAAGVGAHAALSLPLPWWRGHLLGVLRVDGILAGDDDLAAGTLGLQVRF